MTITVTLIGTGPEQAAAGGTNASDTATSQSATWSPGDYVLVGLGVHHNFGTDWVGVSLASSGGALAAPSIVTTAPNLAMGGYKSGSSFLLAQVTSGFTGTISASRTAGSADHWTTGTFFQVTGVNGTIVQAASNNQAAGTNTLALNLGSAPASTSLVAAVLVCNSNDAWSTLAGFTETERAETSWLADHSVQWINTGAAQNNTFTVASNTGGIAGIIIEIADAGGAAPDGSPLRTTPPADPRIPPRYQWVADASSPTGTLFTVNLAGSVTPTGALAKQPAKALAGSSTPAGALAKQPAKALAGSSTASGNPRKAVAKPIAGSVTASGTVANVRAVLIALAGSVTPTGALAKQPAKALAGSSTASGNPRKAVAKPIAGSVTASGTVANVRAVLIALAGSVTPSGALAKQARKALAGSSTPSGAVAKAAAKNVAGSSTPTGALAKRPSKVLAGSSTPSGALAKRVGKALAGSSSPAGVLTRFVRRTFTGAVTAFGTLITSGSSNVPATTGPVLLGVQQVAHVQLGVLSAADAAKLGIGGIDTVELGIAPAGTTQLGIYPPGSTS